MTAAGWLRLGLLALVVGLAVAVLGLELMPASFEASITHGEGSASTSGSIDGKGWVVAGLVIAAVGGALIAALRGRGRVAVAVMVLLVAGAAVLALGVLHLPRPGLYGHGWKVQIRGRGVLELGAAMTVLASGVIAGSCVPRVGGPSIGGAARDVLATAGRLGRLSVVSLVVGATAVVTGVIVMPAWAHLDYFGPPGEPGAAIAGFFDVDLARIWFFVGVPLAAVGAAGTIVSVGGCPRRRAGVGAVVVAIAGIVLLVVGLAQIPRALRVDPRWPKVDLFVPGRGALEFGTARLVVGVVAAATRAGRLRRAVR